MSSAFSQFPLRNTPPCIWCVYSTYIVRPITMNEIPPRCSVSKSVGLRFVCVDRVRQSSTVIAVPPSLLSFVIYIVYWNSYAVAICNARLRLPRVFCHCEAGHKYGEMGSGASSCKIVMFAQAFAYDETLTPSGVKACADS